MTEEIAVHEAAHAVCAYLLCVRIRSVTIESSEGARGRTLFVVPDGFDVTRASSDPDTRDLVERCIKIRFAGPIAHVGSLDREDVYEWSFLEAGIRDFPEARSLALSLTAGDDAAAESESRRLEEEGRQLVNGPRPRAAIEALASRLLESRTLSGEQAEEVIAAALAAFDSQPGTC